MVISRVIIRVTPFRALITYLLSPLPLQVGFGAQGFRHRGPLFPSLFFDTFGLGTKGLHSKIPLKAYSLGLHNRIPLEAKGTIGFHHRIPFKAKGTIGFP